MISSSPLWSPVFSGSVAINFTSISGPCVASEIILIWRLNALLYQSTVQKTSLIFYTNSLTNKCLACHLSGLILRVQLVPDTRQNQRRASLRKELLLLQKTKSLSFLSLTCCSSIFLLCSCFHVFPWLIEYWSRNNSDFSTSWMILLHVSWKRQLIASLFESD